jgi:hypothetical protein
LENKKGTRKKSIFKQVIITLVGLSFTVGTINIMGNPYEFFKLHKGDDFIFNVAIGGLIGIVFLIFGLINTIKLLKYKD